MTVKMIVAMDINRAIGNKDQLPWRCSADLKLFKELTMGGILIMGRKTFDSIGGKSLPGRETYVLTNDESFTSDEATVFNDIDIAIRTAKEANDNVWIAGGASIYMQAAAAASELYISHIETEAEEVDTYLPESVAEGWTHPEVYHEAASVGEQPGFICVRYLR